MPFPLTSRSPPDRPRRHSRFLFPLSLLTTAAASPSRQHALNYQTHCQPTIPSPLLPQHLFTCPLPLREAPSDPLKLSPWTHPPICASAAPGAKIRDPVLAKGWADTNTNKTDIYCVYTNSRAGLGGVSIITTPESAVSLAALMNETPIPPLPWEATIAESFNQTESSRKERPDPPYKLAPVKGKGLGMIATRLIPKWTPIVTDYASLVLDLRFPEIVPRKAGYEVLHAAADRLVQPQRMVYGLGRGGNKLAENVIEDVVRTNAFAADLGGGMYGALYPTVSRFNHACKPNAFPRFHPQSLIVSVAAARDIQPGEEINISYITYGQTSKTRKTELLKWGFMCACDLCTADRAVIRESDNRRDLIEKKRDAVLEAFHRGDAAPAITLTQEILTLMRAEELFPMYPEQYENLARVYRAVGDLKRAREWARRGLETLKEQGYIESVTDSQVEMLMHEFEGPPLPK